MAEIGSEHTATPCDAVGNALLITEMDASANLPTACWLWYLRQTKELVMTLKADKTRIIKW